MRSVELRGVPWTSVHVPVQEAKPFGSRKLFIEPRYRNTADKFRSPSDVKVYQASKSRYESLLSGLSQHSQLRAPFHIHKTTIYNQTNEMDPIKVVVVGATGQTGSLIVDGLRKSETNFVSAQFTLSQ